MQGGAPNAAAVAGSGIDIASKAINMARKCLIGYRLCFLGSLKNYLPMPFTVLDRSVADPLQAER